MSVYAVIPSRGRPLRALQAVDALMRTRQRPDTEVWVVVDRDDPALDGYRRSIPVTISAGCYLAVLEPNATGNLVRATNTISLDLAEEDGAIIGNLGDDHVCRTYGWDSIVAKTLTRPGIAFGDDLFQRDRLPTAPFISREIVRALGWYALPELHHLFIDNVWRDVGEQTGRLTFIPELVIEHVHPLAGKAEWDDGYEKANGEAMVEHDRDAYNAWRLLAMGDDIARVRAALA